MCLCLCVCRTSPSPHSPLSLLPLLFIRCVRRVGASPCILFSFIIYLLLNFSTTLVALGSLVGASWFRMPSNGSSAQSASLLLLLPELLLLLLLLLQLVQQKQKQQQLLLSLTRLYPSNVLACVTTPPAHSQAILRAMPPNATPPASPACLPLTPRSTAAVDFNGCSVARRESQQRCSHTAAAAALPRATPCSMHSWWHCVLPPHRPRRRAACLVAILISPAAQRRIF